MSNISTKKLALIFSVLAIVVLLIFIFDSGQDRTFRDKLVEIDTAAVSQIVIYPKSQPGTDVTLFKEEGDWKVRLESGKVVNVPKTKIDNLIQQLISLKPIRLTAKSKDKWEELQVGESATRVEVYEDSDCTLDLVIGKFSFQQPRSMFTNVRLADETNVYLVEGFLDMTFNQKAEAFRNSNLISGNYNDWNRLAFDYPADSSFQMIKLNNKWYSSDIELDSAKVENYLRQLSRLTNNNYIDQPEIPVNNPTMKLTVSRTDNSLFTVQAFGDTSNYVISSSLNTESYFDGKKNDFYKKIYKGIGEFLQKED
ncbi:MAG: DUF4340 domain-containing protein [Melioribacteraceae bacterium]|nr:DUF4340 domain-containing protein [Melioribacteraceae bacterium]MCO6474325.1 DUF4340 domain-containing protein [Melioribacteraceae bacterium]MDD3558568.1 DUF4340 domain-containing protein [Melioribacteraceae bacterium]